MRRATSSCSHGDCASGWWAQRAAAMGSMLGGRLVLTVRRVYWAMFRALLARLPGQCRVCRRWPGHTLCTACSQRFRTAHTRCGAAHCRYRVRGAVRCLCAGAAAARRLLCGGGLRLPLVGPAGTVQVWRRAGAGRGAGSTTARHGRRGGGAGRCDLGGADAAVARTAARARVQPVAAAGPGAGLPTDRTRTAAAPAAPATPKPARPRGPPAQCGRRVCGGPAAHGATAGRARGAGGRRDDQRRLAACRGAGAARCGARHIAALVVARTPP